MLTLRTLISTVALGVATLTSPSAMAADDAAAHEAALAQARRGDMPAALATMADLVGRHPDDRAYLHDYISLLERAGKPAEALAMAERVDRTSAPAYVLESLAAAAVATAKFAQADDLYATVLRRYPHRREAIEGLAAAGAARIAQSGAVPADRTAGEQLLTGPEWLELLSMQAARLEAEGKFYPALHRNQQILDAAPDNRAAQAALIRLTSRLGATHQAAELAAKYPDAADAESRDTLARHKAAVDARWAERLRSMPKHYKAGTSQLDGSIAQSDALAASFLTTETALTEPQTKWLFDRIVLLAERRRAADAVALHERFARRGIAMPAYCEKAAAGAYLQLRQPSRAVALYERVLRATPEDADARVGLYFSLLESENHDRAYALVDEWAATTDAVGKKQPSAAANEENWNARVLQARAREYTGELGVSQAMLERLQVEAPGSGAVRSGLASLYRGRGWPWRAWDTWQIQLLHDPDDVDAYAESVYPLLDSQRFEQARQQLNEAGRRDPDAGSVARAARAVALHDRPELIVEGNLGRSSDNSSPSGTRDDMVDAYLYSVPIRERYRLYAHGHYAQADLAGGYAHYNRAGGGLEYRAPDLRLKGELHGGISNDGGLGIAAGARWWITDVWNLSASADTRTADIPLQARLARIDARKLHVEIEARVHESRTFAAALGGLNFSDDNERRYAQLSWQEGWITRPSWWINSRVDVYASRNTRDDAPYFNPSSDWSAALSLTGAWRTYRWYEREFVQELTLSAGNYWQENFGSGPLWGIEYAHRWQLNDAFYLRYALGRSLHPYDGEQSGRNYLTLDMDWRF